jgi:hypothetical protein
MRRAARRSPSTDKLLPPLDCRPVAGMEVMAVNPAVNNLRNQGPDLLTPACLT